MTTSDGLWKTACCVSRYIDANVDDLFSAYDSDISDRFAPLHTISSVGLIAVPPHGSTLTVAKHAATVAAVNDATVAVTALPTDGNGSMLPVPVDDSSCTEVRNRLTGRTAWLKTGVILLGIRVDTAGTLLPVITDTATASSSLPSFQPVAVSDLRMSSPMKSSSLDPWPTFLLRECVDVPPCTIWPMH